MTPEQIAIDALAASRIGAHAVHVHVKDEGGHDTFDDGALTDTLHAIHASTPDLQVGVTTGAWALPDPQERVAAIEAWSKLPAFASVNWHEDGADEVAATLLRRGIGVEAGLWNADAVAAWLVSPRRDQCLRVLIEIQDGVPAEETETEAAALLAAVRSQFPGGGLPEVLLHGEGSSAWSALRCAARWGLPTRAGLEDSFVLPDGNLAPDNESLVKAALRELQTHSRSASSGYRMEGATP